MCDGMTCPLCGEPTAYTSAWTPLPKSADGSGGGKYPSTVACRNGCDSARSDEWGQVASGLKDQCALQGAHA